MFVMTLVAVLMLSACSAATPSQPTALPTSSSGNATEMPGAAPTATSEPGPYPFTYSDVLGRSVTIEARPERIVSLAPSVTEILYAVGAGSQVVGRTDYDNYPPEAEAVPSVGGFDASSISIETILDMEPDLVIAGSIYQDEVTKTLEGTGIKVIDVDPESIADILVNIQTLGTITGHAGEAKVVVADMQARIDAVTGKVATIPQDERPLVFYEIWHEPLTTASNHTFTGELITLAGGINIFGDLEGTYPTVSAEQIIEENPDVIVGPSNHSDQLTAEAIAARPGWGDLAAVRNGAVVIIDGDIISRSGPRIIDALEAIARALHPELFGG